jgi:hypothetical protein
MSQISHMQMITITQVNTYTLTCITTHTHTYLNIQVEFINKNSVCKYLNQPAEKEDQYKER